MNKRGPSIVLIMADQLTVNALGIYGNPVVLSPQIDELGKTGIVFDKCYCPSPVCAPSRAAMMAGKLPSVIGVYDNGAEFPASVPTFVHELRRAGYRCVASGKLHYVGPDQLHGFEQRLTTDIYPAGFDWTPVSWEQGVSRNPGSSVREILNSGTCRRSLQIDYDEAVQYQAVQFLYDQARMRTAQPFFLMISYTHPHDPFYVAEPYWNRYRDDDIGLPSIAMRSWEELHPYDRWIQYHHEADRYPLGADQVIKARHAYYGMVSYVDDKVGEIVQTLEQTGLRKETVILFTADHGEMLGERGMWFKRTFYEPSARVPLIVNAPGLSSERVDRNVSLLDLYPTILDLANLSATDEMAGRSLLSRAERPVIAEYLGEGVEQPCRMLRMGPWKYVYVRQQPEQLFNLDDDPPELVNRALDPTVKKALEQCRQHLLNSWDAERERQRIIDSQQARLLLHRALQCGQRLAWDYQPKQDTPTAYVRGVDAQEMSRRRRM